MESQRHEDMRASSRQTLPSHGKRRTSGVAEEQALTNRRKHERKTRRDGELQHWLPPPHQEGGMGAALRRWRWLPQLPARRASTSGRAGTCRARGVAPFSTFARWRAPGAGGRHRRACCLWRRRRGDSRQLSLHASHTITL